MSIWLTTMAMHHVIGRFSNEQANKGKGNSYIFRDGYSYSDQYILPFERKPYWKYMWFEKYKIT